MGSPKPPSLQLPLANKGRYHGDSDDHYYSAKVSDFEAVDSSFTGSSYGGVATSNRGEEDDDDISAQVSDQSTEVEEEESDTSSYSGMESDTTPKGHPIPDLPLVQNIFLTQGKKVEERSEDIPKAPPSESNLIQATKSGDIPLVRELILRGCNLEATDSTRRTALHQACALGRLEIVRLLVEGGANVDAASVAGQTPLHEACIGGRYGILEEMLSEVADLDMVDSKGLSAAHYCAMNGEVQCLTLLCNQVSRNHCLQVDIESALSFDSGSLK